MFTARACAGARTGLFVANGNEVATPAFMVATRRAAVPHLTPDLATSGAAPAGVTASVYAEEMWDREGLVTSAINRQRLPLAAPVVLGAARRPGSPLITNKPNTNNAIGIATAQGSRLALIADIAEFAAELQPDLFLVPYDVPAQTTGQSVGGNRLRKMQARSLDWLRRFAISRDDSSGKWILVAHVPPELRTSEYLSEAAKFAHAFCFTSSAAGTATPDRGEGEVRGATADLRNLPEEFASSLRISDLVPASWADLVKQVRDGVDLIYTPIDRYTDSGRALTLSWSATTPEYMDLNDEKYTTDMTALGGTPHALAYIHHLLSDHEMTAQVLLQIHNLGVVSELFAQMRSAIEAGTFNEDAAKFIAAYS